LSDPFPVGWPGNEWLTSIRVIVGETVTVVKDKETGGDTLAAIGKVTGKRQV
jgi:hypothetical protein